MINKFLIIISLLFTIQVFGDQYALTVITNSKGNDNKSISHISLYKSKNLCSNKLNDIHLLLSKGGSMGVKYKSGILSAKYKNIENTFKCVKISNEFKTDY
tara:strand:+ start:419 stop:721 length:303 start_codon:yes stop_codon:yes gene_type:complete